MINILLLTLSFIGTNGSMFYVLKSHQPNRQYSVSLHASLDKKSYLIFALGHLFGGLAFLLFAYRFFYIEFGFYSLFILSVVGVIAEQVQAFIPHKDMFTKIHVSAATIMAIAISLIIFISPFYFELNDMQSIVYIGLIITLLLIGVYTLFNIKKFYRAQMLFFTLFYVFIAILIAV